MNLHIGDKNKKATTYIKEMMKYAQLFITVSEKEIVPNCSEEKIQFKLTYMSITCTEGYLPNSDFIPKGEIKNEMRDSPAIERGEVGEKRRQVGVDKAVMEAGKETAKM